MHEAVRRAHKRQLANMSVIYSITMKNILKTKRTLFMFLIAMIPLLFSVMYIFMKMSETTHISGLGYFTRLMSVFQIRGVMLVLTVFYGSTVFTDELDRKTLIYLQARPVSSFSMIFGKFLSALSLVSGLLVLSTVSSYTILMLMDGGNAFMGNMIYLWKDLLVMILGSMAYIAFMLALSMMVKKPVLWGLVFMLGWENIVVNIPGPVSKMTLLHWIQSIFPHPSVTNKFLAAIHPESSPIDTSITVLLVATMVFLFVAYIVYSRREYKLN